MAGRVIATTKALEKKQNCPNSCKQKQVSSSSGSTADRILQLQKTAGNQAVQRLIKSRELQAKLKISQPNDVYEQEADRVAEQVMKIPEPAVQRQPGGEGRQDRETIRTKPLISGIAPLTQRLAENKEGGKGEEKEEIFRAQESGNGSAGPGFENRFMQLKGGGSPLPEPTRKSMESRFGTDLSAVKVHSGPGAAGLAREINAKAFTSGKDIYFGENQFNPGTGGGDKLLAHEMTHVIQQSGNSSGQVSRTQLFSDAENAIIARKEGDSSAKTDTKTGSPAAGETAPGIVELKGISEFKPPEQVSNYFNEKQAGNVQVRFGNLAEGVIKVEKSKGKSDSEGYRINNQAIPLKHSIFAGLDPGPNLIINTNKGPVQGYIGIGKGGSEAFIRQLKEYPERIGLPGFDLLGGGKISNKLENGVMEFGFEGIPIKLGGAFSGTLTLKAVNENVTFNGNANVNVGGLGSGNLILNRSEKGLVKGEVNVGVNLKKNVTGEVTVFWTGEVIEGKGSVGYQGEKLSGNILLNVMEKKEAEKLAAEKKAPTGEETQGKGVAKTKNKHAKLDYAVFGEGDLTFAFNEWLNGTAHTIVDQHGYVTVIGKITPQKEFELFPQKDYNKDLFKLEARASYGIPVVGNIFIFANVGMSAFAKIGPAKFYKIEVDGTYSTDPKKNKDFSIRGSLNISAAAGLKLRGEAGAGLEILAHDIKAGAGINGIAGIKGYAEATPIIGYREKGTAGEDKKGEFFIRGELEIAAQPFLGLSGDLFVEIESPWWSPVPDKKWTWPLFGKEWPIGGNLGINASVDYVFGSGIPPALEFKPVEFSADKFMTDLYSDKAQAKSGEKEPQKGGWAEKNSKGAEPPAKAVKKGNAQLGKAPEPPKAKSKVQPGGAKKAKKDPDPNARTKDGKTVKQLKDEAAKKGKKPEGKEPKGKGEEKGKSEDKEKGAQIAKDKVKAELKAKLPKGAKQAEDVNKVLNGIAPKVKPSLSNLHAEEVNPGKPKNEGAIGFKVKGKEENKGDVLIDSVRYSSKGSLSPEEQWKKGVEGVMKAISKLEERGIDEDIIKNNLPKLATQYKFSRLDLKVTEEEWIIEGVMNPKGTVGKLKSVTQKDLKKDVNFEKVDYNSGMQTVPLGTDNRFPRTNTRQTRVKGHIDRIKKANEGRSSHRRGSQLAGHEVGDHGGHLVGDRFYGPGGRKNVVPMKESVNLSDFPSKFEIPVADWIKEKKKKREAWLVYVTIGVVYNDNAIPRYRRMRPVQFSAWARGITAKRGKGQKLIIQEKSFRGTFSN